jgi:hypothetical protein
VKSTLCFALAAILAAAAIAFAGDNATDTLSTSAKYSDAECQVLRVMLHYLIHPEAFAGEDIEGVLRIDPNWLGKGKKTPETRMELVLLDSTRDGRIARCEDGITGGTIGAETGRPVDLCADEFRKKWNDDYPDASQDLFDDFYAKNQTAWRLPDSSKLDYPISQVSKFKDFDEADEAYKMENLQKGIWIYQGTAEVSRVGLNKDRTQALVYAGVQGGFLAGCGDLYFLILTDDGWKIKKKVVIWVA